MEELVNQHVIKKSALEKLDEFVKGELQYLVDNEYPLNKFNIDNMLPDNLDEKEKKEVINSIQQLKEGAVIFYCKCRGIDIPKKLINKEMKEIIKNESVEKTEETEPKEKKRELLTSTRVLKSGQQLLTD